MYKVTTKRQLVYYFRTRRRKNFGMRKNIPEDKKGKGKESRKGIIKKSLKINTNITNYNIKVLSVLFVHKIKIYQTPKQKKAGELYLISTKWALRQKNF